MPSHEFQVALGRVLRAKRLELRLSQEQFAATVGLHRTYISSVERGKRNASLRSLLRIATALGLPLSSLIAEAEDVRGASKEIRGPEVTAAEELNRIALDVRPGQLDLIIEMARAMTTPINEVINTPNDIVVPTFASDFSNRLLLHHATTDQKFTKKAFEYAFKAASISAGKRAVLNRDPTAPGTDVWVNGVAYSLKTEAAASIRPDKITISKLAEARWIRECRTSADFAREIAARVVGHLEKYERIIILRAFELEASRLRYDLIEVPRELLLRMRDLTPDDFGPRTPNGGSRADVRISGRHVFTVRLDGSVEKVTISGLLVSECVPHASWTIPTSWVREPAVAQSDDPNSPTRHRQIDESGAE